MLGCWLLWEEIVTLGVAGWLRPGNSWRGLTAEVCWLRAEGIDLSAWRNGGGSWDCVILSSSILVSLFLPQSTLIGCVPSPLSRDLLGENQRSCCCSVTQSCPALCDPMDCSTPGFPVQRRLLEFAQTHAHWVDDVTQTSHPLSPPFPPALNLFQHQKIKDLAMSLKTNKKKSVKVVVRGSLISYKRKIETSNLFLKKYFG